MQPVLGKVHLPDGLAADVMQWKRERPDSSPEAFIFANADGGLLDPGTIETEFSSLSPRPWSCPS